MFNKISLFRSLPLAMVLLVAGAGPLLAQGMLSAEPAMEGVSEQDAIELTNLSRHEAATIQRLLYRLGYLTEAQLTREMDADTTEAIIIHLKEVNGLRGGMNSERIIRSLFTMAWVKEGWSSGTVHGQELVVDRADVRAAQTALTLLNLAPGPIDGVFGPATLAAVENFQDDNGMNVTGLLSRNNFQNIMRAQNWLDKKPDSVVHVLNWADYISPDALDEFEKTSGVRVIHEVFESSSETKDLLLQGSQRYDVMIQAGAQMRQVLEAGGAVEKLDFARLPNAAGLDPATLKFTSVLGPENLHSVPYMWGTVGLGVNKEAVLKIRPDAPLDSMAMILDPALAADLSKCGIAVVDEPNDTIPAFVSYLGGDAANISITDLEAVDEALARVAQFIKVIPVETYIDSLADGKYCVAWGYSGDVFTARDQAKEKGTGTITYNVPTEGSQLWFDLLVIPNKSQNKDGAYKLIDYMLEPKVAATNTNFLQYANPVKASAPFIEISLLKDPGLYPPRKVMNRLAVQPPLPVDLENELKRIWEKLPRE